MRAVQTYSRIEETSADPKENPSIDDQREAEGETDIEQLGSVRSDRNSRSGLSLRLGVCYLGSREGEEEEKDGAGELAAHGNEMVPDTVRQKANERHPFAMVPGSADIHGCWCW